MKNEITGTITLNENDRSKGIIQREENAFLGGYMRSDSELLMEKSRYK